MARSKVGVRVVDHSSDAQIRDDGCASRVQPMVVVLVQIRDGGGGPGSDPSSANAFGSVDNDPKKDYEVTNVAWDIRVTSNQNSSWGTVTDGKAFVNSDQAGVWGSQGNCSNNATTHKGFGSIASDSWDKPGLPSGDREGSSKDSGDNWGKGKLTIVSPADASGSWDKAKSPNEEGSWGKGKNVTGNSTGPSTGGDNRDNVDSRWNQQKSVERKCDDVGGDRSTWGKVVKSQGEGNDNKRIQEDSCGRERDIGAGWYQSSYDTSIIIVMILVSELLILCRDHSKNIKKNYYCFVGYEWLLSIFAGVVVFVLDQSGRKKGYWCRVVSK